MPPAACLLLTVRMWQAAAASVALTLDLNWRPLLAPLAELWAEASRAPCHRPCATRDVDVQRAAQHALQHSAFKLAFGESSSALPVRPRVTVPHCDRSVEHSVSVSAAAEVPQ